MKKLLSVCFALLGLVSVTVASLSTSAYAEKKCEDGYVWDKKLKKCVKEVRGSHQ